MQFKATAAAVAMTILPAMGMAAEPVQIGKFNDWTAYSFDDPGGKICYVVSEPKKADGNYAQRGDVYFLVTHRPESKVFDEASIITGYVYRDGNEPVATINGGKSFRFYTDGDSAWAAQDSEKDLVAAMKAGSTMVVKGTSNRGTLTTDTYSLSGITAALRKIDEECQRK